MTSGAAEDDRHEAAARWQPPAKFEPSAVPPPAEAAEGPPDALDRIVEATRPGAAARDALARFLGEPSPARALALWIAWTMPPGRRPDRQHVLDRLSRDIARLDETLSRQVNAILHHPRFQRLEAAWRGLRWLADQAADAEGVQIRVLSVSWKELARDLERAIEFDQSQLFRKVYSEEFDMPGGEPFGVLIGDYQVRPGPSREHPVNDMAVLRGVSQVAAAAFAPFVCGAHPAMFGLDDFSDLERPANLGGHFQQLDFREWNSFREAEDARFTGLTLPRILLRLPYDDDGTRVDRFCFREDVSEPDRRGYLWGNAAFAFGSVLIRAFAESGWLAAIRGVRRDVLGGGVVADLPVHCFSTDKLGVAPKCSTDTVITDYREQELSELGFMPLCHVADTELSAFYANQSVQKPKRYDDAAATVNARISSMLQYMLCVSRFAHYLKVVAREKVGSFAEPEELERFLQDWLLRYVAADSDASPDVKARYPLREARVRVRRVPSKPGAYVCVFHLWPHYELDELSAAVKITTELVRGEGR